MSGITELGAVHDQQPPEAGAVHALVVGQPSAAGDQTITPSEPILAQDDLVTAATCSKKELLIATMGAGYGALQAGEQVRQVRRRVRYRRGSPARSGARTMRRADDGSRLKVALLHRSGGLQARPVTPRRWTTAAAPIVEDFRSSRANSMAVPLADRPAVLPDVGLPPTAGADQGAPGGGTASGLGVRRGDQPDSSYVGTFSNARPTARKCQPSSWLITWSVSPAAMAHRSETQRR